MDTQNGMSTKNIAIYAQIGIDIMINNNKT